MRRRRLLKGIREKLVLSFSLLIACIAAFVFVFFPTRLERQAMRAMSAKASAIRDMTSYSLSAGLFFADHAAVREVLAGASRGGDIVFLAVHDAQGERVATVGQVPMRGIQPSRTRTSFVSPDGGTFISASPVLHGAARIGSLTVGISLAELREEVANARRLGALVGSLIFLVGLFIIFAISTLVTRPLKAVSDTVRKIAAGDLHLRAAETSDVEVAQFVQSFNHMVDGLARAQSELSAVNQELEARVDARTAELLSAIADQRRAQEALAQSESQARGTSEMLQSLIDVAPQAIIALDLGWRVTRWNRAAERLFGWTAGEVIGKALPNVPEDQRAQFERLDEQLANDEKGSAEEVIRLRKDGTRVSVLRAVSALRDSAQNRVGYIGVFTDLTERKSLEAQLRQSQKMEAIGRLAGGVAHDFNNMLTVITSCAAMLLDRVEGAEERADLDEITAAATRASALTRQLLLFSRRQVVHRQPVNISDTVGNMVPMLRRLLRENIQFTTALAGSIGTVTADPTQLEQVIMNLVVNASDAMPDGGSLTVETQNVELDEIYANHHTDVTPGQYVMLVVSDTGIGMDASTVSKIFEPFFTTKEAGKGTGLGLATTYAVVSQLGGHIRVYSEPGHGTAFKIYLPRETAESKIPSEESTHGQPERSSTVRETILLVEDEDIVRRAIRRTLEQHGYHVLEAVDGESGLATAAAHEGEIHAVVTDLMMPGMNGRRFIDLLHNARTGFRVVFMSGYTDETVSQRGLVDSTHTFLQKPFSGAQLAKALNELMHESPVAAR